MHVRLVVAKTQQTPVIDECIVALKSVAREFIAS